jgi:CO/xanthine dehydrogenase Mo-binding subunit
MKKRGSGLAAIEYPTGMNQGGDPSQAWIKMKPDGRVDVFAGTVDLGQGSKTVHTQIVADTMGVPYDWVTMDVSNTDSSPLCTGTFASRGTFIGGNAVAVAAQKAKTKLLEVAGQLMEIDPSDLEVVEGEVVARGVPDKKMPIPDVAGGATWVVGDMISGSGAWMKPYSVPDQETGECEPHAAISYAACVAEVEVDDETGEVTILRLVQAYDVGRAINPTLVEGQIEGGAMMGLGLALLEASYPYYPSNEHRGGEFGSYLAPALADMPEIESVIVENPSVDGPFGAKAIGEMANNAQAPAVCAAIYDAVGVWVTEQPATPERVLRALEAKQAGSDGARREGKRHVFDDHHSIETLAPDSWLTLMGTAR